MDSPLIHVYSLIFLSVYSCRRIDSHLNIFTNILANKFFIGIFLICVLGQVVIVQFGGAAFQVVALDAAHWAIALVIGVISLPIGVVIRLIPDNIFGFLFRDPVTREKYLGGSGNTVPAVYMAGNERLPWNSNERSNTMRSRSSKHNNDNHSFASGSIRSLE
jgi:Ca2+-transporting ATPase